VLYGNLRRRRGRENHRQGGLKFTGSARVFDSEEDSLRGFSEAKLNRAMVVIRYKGPKAAPACARCKSDRGHYRQRLGSELH